MPRKSISSSEPACTSPSWPYSAPSKSTRSNDACEPSASNGSDSRSADADSPAWACASRSFSAANRSPSSLTRRPSTWSRSTSSSEA